METDKPSMTRHKGAPATTAALEETMTGKEIFERVMPACRLAGHLNPPCDTCLINAIDAALTAQLAQSQETLKGIVSHLHACGVPALSFPIGSADAILQMISTLRDQREEVTTQLAAMTEERDAAESKLRMMGVNFPLDKHE